MSTVTCDVCGGALPTAHEVCWTYKLAPQDHLGHRQLIAVGMYCSPICSKRDTDKARTKRLVDSLRRRGLLNA